MKNKYSINVHKHNKGIRIGFLCKNLYDTAIIDLPQEQGKELAKMLISELNIEEFVNQL